MAARSFSELRLEDEGALGDVSIPGRQALTDFRLESVFDSSSTLLRHEGHSPCGVGITLVKQWGHSTIISQTLQK